MEKFIDRVKIYVRAGKGGDGAVAFLREKYRPKGGPAGGDGGRGGNVILVATSSKNTLLDFKYKKHFIAEDGEPGKGKKMHGKKGEDLIIYVPVGTVVKDAQTGEIICDLVKDGQTCIVARGGKGGRGNARFATPTNQAPTYAEKGEPGEEKWIILELKLIADVGLIGFPNVGKSTLLARLTRANPKIADYPFTTLSPNLGVMELDWDRRLVIADIPGLIEDAHKGAGLGHEFLRHIERTKFLAHIIDVSDFREREPIQAFEAINKELALYSQELVKKPQIVVANKIDALSDKELIEDLKNYFKERGYEFYAISALTGEGLEELKEGLWKKYERLKKQIKKSYEIFP